MERPDDARAVLLDLDGVLYVEGELVDGAVEAVAALRDAGLGLRFVTNTTSRSRAQTLEKLRSFGFDVADEELETPARLAVAHCREEGLRRAVLLMRDEVKADFEGLEEVGADAGSAEVVIAGDLGEGWNFEVMNRAFRLVMDGAELLALQRNRYWLTEDGLSLDVGAFVAALEYSTSREAIVVGKPTKRFFDLVLDGLGASPGEAAMVGDDVETDIGGAQDAGLAGVLVRTGKYRDEVVAKSGIEPAATVDSIADVPGLLAGNA